METNVVYSVLSIFVCSLVSGVSGDYCDQNGTTVYCPGGSCCGTSYKRYCCSDIDGGTIAGIVIGCLIFVSMVVSLIVCCICCLRKSRGSPGQVIGQGGPTTVLTSSSPYPTGPVQQVLYSPGQSAFLTHPTYPVLSPYNPAQPAYNPAQPAYSPSPQLEQPPPYTPK